MESSLKHAGWNKRADWNFTQKTINVQDLIRACRMIKKFEINKRACTFIRYFRVPTLNFQATESILSCLPPSWPEFLHGEKILFASVISILFYLHKIPDEQSQNKNNSKSDFLFGILR